MASFKVLDHPIAPHTDEPAGAEALRSRMITLLPELRGYARYLARERAEADDLVQEALLRALSALASFREPEGAARPGSDPFKAWLFTIQRNLFFEQTRRRRSERAMISATASGEEPRMDGGQEGAHALGDLHRLLWRLSPVLREALVLVGAQGLDYEQAAGVCGVPVGTIKARVSRARRQLAAMMGVPPMATGPGQLAG